MASTASCNNEQIKHIVESKMKYSNWSRVQYR